MKLTHRNIIKAIVLVLVWTLVGTLFDYFKLPVTASRIVFFLIGGIYVLI